MVGAKKKAHKQKNTIPMRKHGGGSIMNQVCFSSSRTAGFIMVEDIINSYESQLNTKYSGVCYQTDIDVNLGTKYKPDL